MGTKVSKSQIAVEFDVSTVAIDHWIRLGCPVAERDQRGRVSAFDIGAVFRWYAAWKGYEPEKSLGYFDFPDMTPLRSIGIEDCPGCGKSLEKVVCPHCGADVK